MASTLDFLFVGTAKAGTTTLYHFLKQHPDISIPVKETFYYIKDIFGHNHLPYPMQRPLQELILEDDQFEELYSSKDSRLKGEIGTGYLYHHRESIPRIKKHLGSSGKVLIVLRHPTDRCYSSYKHFAKDLHEKGSFEEALQKEESRIAEEWDFMWHHRAMSEYGAQVEAFCENFSEVKILIYEEFIRAPEATAKEIFEFLGVDPNIKMSNAQRYNTSGEPRFKALQRLITQENPVKAALRPLFRKMFSKEKRERIRKGVKNRNLKSSDSISEKMKNELDAYFAKDIARVEALLGRPIEAWKR
jgi:hypothetical protein